MHALYIVALQNEGTEKQFEYFTDDILEKYYSHIKSIATLKTMLNAQIQWHHSAYVTAKYLVDNDIVSYNHNIHHNSRHVRLIYQRKNVAFKNTGRPNLNNDKWNPGDIWAIQKDLDIKSIKSILDHSSVENLNRSLLYAYNNKLIIPISLKQINDLSKSATHIEYNNTPINKLDNHEYNSINLMGFGGDFWRNKHGMITFDGDKKMDIRTTTNFGPIGMELILDGSRGGKASFTQIRYAAKTFLEKDIPVNSKLKDDASKLYLLKNINTFEEFYRMVSNIHPELDKNDFGAGMLESEDYSRIHANLGIAYIADAIHQSNKKQRDNFMSYIVNYAGSKTTDSSVYLTVLPK